MNFSYERSLIFAKSQKWTGWCCKRCCWNHPLPAEPTQQQKLSSQIKQLFEEHSCETFAQLNWRTNA